MSRPSMPAAVPPPPPPPQPQPSAPKARGRRRPRGPNRGARAPSLIDQRQRISLHSLKLPLISSCCIVVDIIAAARPPILTRAASLVGPSLSNPLSASVNHYRPLTRLLLPVFEHSRGYAQGRNDVDEFAEENSDEVYGEDDFEGDLDGDEEDFDGRLSGEDEDGRKQRYDSD
ncbi:hypothetical protein Cni_G17106 [Canna indica]|uniref:Uncharacterized protein n=1 Tax=Canna indica TaxID=4628 RepID=A0AAQ3QGG0_9LILI|nr:hypothetical protein Cni_G17106 [Canna indica]